MEQKSGFHRELFIGREAEGFEKGELTLFVGSHLVTNERIQTVLEECPEVRRVYFGASNKNGISDHNVELLKPLLDDGYRIFLEVDSVLQLEKIHVRLLQRIETVLVMRIGNPARTQNFCVDHFKIVAADRLMWWKLKGRRKITSLDDPLYDSDKEVSDDKYRI